MSRSTPPSSHAGLRARLAALPLDRGPLRRAGLLSLLLVALLVAGKVFGPGRPAAASTLGERNEGAAPTEEVSVARPASGWTGGRVLALILLAAGGAGALLLHRRRPAASGGADAALEVLETRTLGPGQSLRLVACADEVLLLAVTAEATTLLRHWPRDRFDAGDPSADGAPSDAPALRFADALAEAAAASSEAEPVAPPAASMPALPATTPAPPLPAPPSRTWGLHQFGTADA